jgi:hypothetical protein
MKISRRYLLKGSLAAPLVLTVRSAAGHGMAMTSAAACRFKDRDRAEDDHDKPRKFRKYAHEDEWLRRECKICRLEKKNDKGHYKVLHDEEYFKGDDGCYWQLKKNGGDYDVIQKSDYRPPKVREYQQLRKEYGLVAVDDNGHVKGWAWEKPQYHPITGSCWASVKLI